MKLNVKNIIGSTRCIVRADGHKIYDHIHTTLQGGEDVTLDFAGVNHYASPFFNHAVGRLFQDIDAKVLEHKLHFENINSIGRNIVKCVKKNAARYYNDPDYSEAVDSVLARQDDEET